MAGSDNRWRSGIPCPIPGDGGRGRGGFSRSTGVDRCPSCRPSPDPRRRGRHRGSRPAGTYLVGEDDHLGRGGAAALLGLVYWTNGDLDAAHRWYADGMASLEKAGYLSDVVGGAITGGPPHCARSLREAMSKYQRGLRVATEHAAPVLRGAADMHVGMSQLCYERMSLTPPAAPADE